MSDTLDISKIIHQAVNCWYFHFNNYKIKTNDNLPNNVHPTFGAKM
jgi:hypothetical protein